MKRFKAVVVDDESGIALLMKELLSQEGFEVLTFANSLEAFEVVKEANVDIFFVDYLLPGMRGDHFIQELREQDHHAPVILMTGLSKMQVKESSAATYQDVLEKPFSIKDVMDLIDEHVKNPQTP
ncbi:response regulator [Alkalibacillus silvisoli]|uniref:Response regulatory domain-containing protein n=1 Tax=Alkalibacillus silvisoli TaxID=392823 RepID=A0ABN1A6S3_9BACI